MTGVLPSEITGELANLGRAVLNGTFNASIDASLQTTKISFYTSLLDNLTKPGGFLDGGPLLHQTADLLNQTANGTLKANVDRLSDAMNSNKPVLTKTDLEKEMAKLDNFTDLMVKNGSIPAQPVVPVLKGNEANADALAKTDLNGYDGVLGPGKLYANLVGSLNLNAFNVDFGQTTLTNAGFQNNSINTLFDNVSNHFGDTMLSLLKNQNYGFQLGTQVVDNTYNGLGEINFGGEFLVRTYDPIALAKPNSLWETLIAGRIGGTVNIPNWGITMGGSLTWPGNRPNFSMQFSYKEMMNYRSFK